MELVCKINQPDPMEQELLIVSQDDICSPRSFHRTRRRAMRRKMGSCLIVALAFVLATSWAATALGESGIPVTSDKVLNMCTDCHKNNRGLVSRISYLRQAPEAWEETLWRHKRIHGLSITTEGKGSLSLYFSQKNALA